MSGAFQARYPESELLTLLAMPAAYSNALSAEDAETEVRAAYGSAYSRLAEIKLRYDPTNFFRLNANIKPAATGTVSA